MAACATAALGRGAHAPEEGFGRGFLEAGGVDEAHVTATESGLGLLAIASYARLVGDEGGTAAGETVEERRLAHVRPTRDHDDRERHGRRGGMFGQRKAVSLPSSVSTRRAPFAAMGAWLAGLRSWR